MALKYLMERKRRLAQKSEHLVSLGYIKDAIMCQLQPMYGAEIIDIDLGPLDRDGMVNTTIYTKKGAQTRTRKV
jgi:hypothetical protein